MRAKVILTKNFGMKTSTKKQWTPNSSTRFMKENREIVQEIQ